MPIPSRSSIQGQIERQNDALLKRGKIAGKAFDAIRERHFWSTYYFTRGFPGSAISSGVGPAILGARTYDVFVQVSGANGQGLPAGFDLTDNSTNMPGARRIADDHNLIVRELGVSILPSPQAVVAQSQGAMTDGQVSPIESDLILTNGVLAIKYLTNVVPIGPLAHFAQAGGPMIAGHTLLDYAQAWNLAGNQLQGGQGELPPRQPIWSHTSGPIPAMPKLRRRLDVPIYLPSKITYNFQIVFPRPVVLPTPSEGGRGGFRIRIDLYGWETFKKQG